MDALSAYLQSKRRLVDWSLDRYLPKPATEPRVIHECMRYSTSGGKRLRPILAIAVAEMLSCDVGKVLPTCVALELIHTHSLILDDLPCMDDDDQRRGKPASHIMYGESVALLAADALLNLAISMLGANHRLAGLSPKIALEIIREVGEAVGTEGVIAGQAADLSYCAAEGDGSLLKRIHINKTACLFRLSARAGALVAEASPHQLGAISIFSENLGLAFQIVDDILDQRQNQIDQKNGRGKPNYAVTCGIDVSRAAAIDVTEKATQALSIFGDNAEVLRQLAQYNLAREW
ncbi:MAG: polyprenyl synthetase family protein [Chloroflexota bacterium]|jgi:geranylgeranyl diphosphate synthase type II